MQCISYFNNFHKKDNCALTCGKRTYIVKPENKNRSRRIFIVHGHDAILKEEIARMLEKQGIDVVLLSERVSSGRTIVEKIEKYSQVDAAICLLTCDDVGKEKGEKRLKGRSRQNVIFETGYFIHKLGRDKVILVCDPEVELPSDLQGIVYSTKEDWNISILKELKEIGFDIDLNKLFI